MLSRSFFRLCLLLLFCTVMGTPAASFAADNGDPQDRNGAAKSEGIGFDPNPLGIQADFEIQPTARTLQGGLR